MGFRVGINCFDTRLQADDYLLSALPPTITAEGKIIRAERQQETFAKKPFLRQPKPKHRFSTVFAPNHS